MAKDALRARSEPGGLPARGRLHVFEPTGHGGIAQHAVALVRAMLDAGHPVTLHTAEDHEPIRDPPLALCPCVQWARRSRGGALRKARNVQSVFLGTLPHLLREVGPDDVLHVQGAAWAPLALAPLASLRLRGRRVVFSPHNTFSRRASRSDEMLLRAAARVAHANIAFSERDELRLREWGAVAVRSPLIHPRVEPDPLLVRRWRERWGADPGTHVVLFAGQIRRDKRLDLLIESASGWPPDRRLTVVGEDRGDWPRCHALAARLGVDVTAALGYLDLDDFEAAIAAADALVAPYERASQSGVLVLARELGTPAISSDVGGLGELALATFPPGDVAGLRRALDAVLADGRRAPEALDVGEAVAAHRVAYGLAAAS